MRERNDARSPSGKRRHLRDEVERKTPNRVVRKTWEREREVEGDLSAPPACHDRMSRKSRKMSNDSVMIDDHDGSRSWYASLEELFGFAFLLPVKVCMSALVTASHLPVHRAFLLRDLPPGVDMTGQCRRHNKRTPLVNLTFAESPCSPFTRYSHHSTTDIVLVLSCRYQFFSYPTTTST